MKSKSFTGFLIGVSLFGFNLFNFSQSSPAPVPNSQLSWHEVLHNPVVNGKKIDPKQYLTLPFKEKNYDLYQGFIYSVDELKIHKGNPVHGGVDYELPYGTEVIAPVDGVAMSSYMSVWVKDDETELIRLYQGKPVRLGLGYFVRMYVPSQDRFLDFGHLSDIDPEIPFSLPEKKQDDWYPTNYILTKDDWVEGEHIVSVKKGQVIGKVGYSGLGWGTEEEYKEGDDRPTVTDPNKFISWDKPHIHFEEFSIDFEKGIKCCVRDPYDIYDTFDFYPTPKRKTQMGQQPLFILSKDNLPEFASDTMNE